MRDLHTRDQKAEIGFVLALGRALHHFGTPAHRLEEAMASVCRRLNLDSEFFSTPTSLTATFGDPADLRSVMLRVDGGALDMAKLAQVDHLADLVADHELSPAEGMRRLDAIMRSPPAFGRPAVVVATAMVAASVAVFFGAGLRDLAVAGGVGLLLGLLSLIMSRTTAQARVFELVGAFVAALGAATAARWIDGVSASVVTVAALIPLLPGMTLTVAMTELATRNLVSGTARMMSAVIVLLQLALGVAIGERAATALWTIPAVTPVPLPGWAEWIALFVACLSMVVLVQAELRTLGWVLVATLVGFVGTRLGGEILGPEIGVFFGAFALGVVANVYARLLDRPATVVLTPAALLLVPGSMGFRGISSMVHRNTLSGVETTFAMFVVAMAIVAGLLIANATVSPRRVL